VIRVAIIIACLLAVASAHGQAEMWWALRSAQNAEQREAIRSAVDEFSAKIQAALAMTGDDNITSDGMADVYPSEKGAVEAIVEAFVAQAKSSPGFNVRQTRIIVASLSPERSGIPPLPDGNVNVSGTFGGPGYSVQISPSATDQAQEQAISFAMIRLRQLLPSARIYAGTMPEALAPGEAALGIGVGEIELVVQQSNPVIARGFRGKVAGLSMIGQIQRPSETSFGIQQWADNSAEFFKQQPSKRWIIARSAGAFPTSEEAIRSACDRAANQFALENTGRTQRFGSPMPFDTLKSLAFAHFINGGTTDRIVQRFGSPMSASWRASVLVSSSDNALRKILPVNQPMVLETQSARTTYTFSARGVLAMVIVVVVLFFFLKIATRGSFTVHRTILAIVIMLLAGLLVIALFGVRPVSTSEPRAVIIR